ncbi:10747_t:CDS:2 [Scutellospora calospora]|uniref:10747_t:CDS:1 n=1 Tax=Scutellospora calospora TaxID=85575 RepID=A0ACA9KWU3_9GLOM|nr:10747_t:CDS:2 [Scutellospora calospora]
MSVAPPSITFSTSLGITSAISSGVMSTALPDTTSTTSLDVISVASMNIRPVSLASVDTSPLVVTTLNLSPDEKRSLLYNLKGLLEIPMDDFDDNWWPLVSNIWTKWDSYKHADGDIRKVFACHFMKHRESSTRKKENILNEKHRITKTRPSDLCHAKVKVSWLITSKVVIRTLVENEAIKNYSPQAITAAVKEYAATKLGLGASVRELNRKEVTNIKYKVRGPMEAHLIGSSDLKSDISEAITYLKNQGYLVENYRVPSSLLKIQRTKPTDMTGVCLLFISVILLDVGMWRSESESAAFNYHINKVSAYSVEDDILKEIHKFPLPFQHLLIKEACAVINRLKKGKGVLGLTSLDCHCLFRNRYLLPCKHIFYEHMYSNNLLTTDIWKKFQETFEESEFEVYVSQESFVEYVQSEQQKSAENRRIAVVELTERVRDRYWCVEETGNVERVESYISMLETSLNPIILQFN